MEFEVLKRLLPALEARAVDYAIFGAIAMSIHGLVRATEDLDVFIGPDPANIDRLKAALRDVWDDPEIDSITADDLLGSYPAMRYTPVSNEEGHGSPQGPRGRRDAAASVQTGAGVMPVRKFRSIEEMSEPVWRTPGDPELYTALASLWALARRIRPRVFPAGVYKHRSIEDMNQQRDEWTASELSR